MSYMKSYEYVKSILSGCGVESLLVELGAIFRNLIDEYTEGRVSEEKFNEYVGKLCYSITELASRCNKELSMEVCVNELSKKLKSDAYAGTGISLLEKFRQSLRRKSQSSGESPTIIGMG